MENKKTIGLWSAVSIGIGGMVGGGIFAVLGLAVNLSHGGAPLAFIIAGLVALITAYSYAKLSVTFPSSGGTVEFLNQGLGTGIITGGLNILLWISYVVMLSLYSYAFGSYGATFFPETEQTFWRHILTSSVIISFTLLNFLSAKVVGKSEEAIVAIKISILVIFVVIGFWSVQFEKFEPSTWSAPLSLMAGGMIIFLAYEGFELISNTAGDVKDPKKNLPRAFYVSVLFVIGLYVMVSMVTVGNLPVERIVESRDFALAESAKPFLGHVGFVAIAVAALLSTSSAINATLYGASRISYIIAKTGELPSHLERKIWNRPIEGLIITSILTLIIANFFDLASIAIMGSAGFLLIFAAVNFANFRLSKKTSSKKLISFTGCIGCLVALGVLVWESKITSPENIWIFISMIVVAFAIEIVYRKISNRRHKRYF
ncbi:Proline-specific permease ProY protein [Marine Group I thaumarchaeote SCGC AAA799-E16]|uniref:Proline-specific permease ProY protein n=3 Tax=Marine Group I TaxID=905826 RepID=A0A087S9B2_9ARCH|nr:Proline-specific permease ProY protein [Marine Group I thaumarchaeote SCGC AAA799-E16]KFM18423.1 amino acid transporter protein [Marine Group I thaumarchaeote SCGC RSA3]KFM22316.1 Proline-specific permease ProY protein [Marine Group I thaumarchaeote SCGC AAA799-B03]